MLSFRKTKRTGVGTSLVSLFMRNLRYMGFRTVEQYTLLVPYRVIVLTCGMTSYHERKQPHRSIR